MITGYYYSSSPNVQQNISTLTTNFLANVKEVSNYTCNLVTKGYKALSNNWSLSHPTLALIKFGKDAYDDTVNCPKDTAVVIGTTISINLGAPVSSSLILGAFLHSEREHLVPFAAGLLAASLPKLVLTYDDEQQVNENKQQKGIFPRHMMETNNTLNNGTVDWSGINWKDDDNRIYGSTFFHNSNNGKVPVIPNHRLTVAKQTQLIIATQQVFYHNLVSAMANNSNCSYSQIDAMMRAGMSGFLQEVFPDMALSFDYTGEYNDKYIASHRDMFWGGIIWNPGSNARDLIGLVVEQVAPQVLNSTVPMSIQVMISDATPSEVTTICEDMVGNNSNAPISELIQMNQMVIRSEDDGYNPPNGSCSKHMTTREQDGIKNKRKGTETWTITSTTDVSSKDVKKMWGNVEEAALSNNTKKGTRNEVILSLDFMNPKHMSESWQLAQLIFNANFLEICNGQLSQHLQINCSGVVSDMNAQFSVQLQQQHDTPGISGYDRIGVGFNSEIDSNNNVIPNTSGVFVSSFVMAVVSLMIQKAMEKTHVSCKDLKEGVTKLFSEGCKDFNWKKLAVGILARLVNTFNYFNAFYQMTVNLNFIGKGGAGEGILMAVSMFHNALSLTSNNLYTMVTHHYDKQDKANETAIEHGFKQKVSQNKRDLTQLVVQGSGFIVNGSVLFIMNALNKNHPEQGKLYANITTIIGGQLLAVTTIYISQKAIQGLQQLCSSKQVDLDDDGEDPDNNGNLTPVLNPLKERDIEEINLLEDNGNNGLLQISTISDDMGLGSKSNNVEKVELTKSNIHDGQNDKLRILPKFQLPQSNLNNDDSNEFYDNDDTPLNKREITVSNIDETIPLKTSNKNDSIIVDNNNDTVPINVSNNNDNIDNSKTRYTFYDQSTNV